MVFPDGLSQFRRHREDNATAIWVRITSRILV